jgi:membrane-associated phospholipid phosphatase
MKLFAIYGIILLGMLLLAAWWGARSSAEPIRNVGAAVWAGTCALIAVSINQVIGSAFARARPYDAISNVHILLDKTKDFSFPSDHATAAGAVAAGLLLANRKLGIMASFVAALLAFARVYAGAHYPGDVAAGLLLGCLIAVGLRGLGMRILKPLLTELEMTPLHPVVRSSPR